MRDGTEAEARVERVEMHVESKVKPTSQPMLSQTPGVVSGAVVFAGTRVPVEMLFDYLAAGEPLESFLSAFDIPQEQATAVLRLAGEIMRDTPPKRVVLKRRRPPTPALLREQPRHPNIAR